MAYDGEELKSYYYIMPSFGFIETGRSTDSLPKASYVLAS